MIFVGFAAQGTLARQIIDGANTVRIFGEEIPVTRAGLYHQRLLRPRRPGGAASPGSDESGRREPFSFTARKR